ncbi:restriction endonuclease subunit S [Streptomyces sp. NPDC087901]|uniref:restriction endonuclease subunit S n=1 Tax=Streptomyces sp. NPDC087901 TaxID=3365818 RepID=UPI0037F5D3FE
MTSANEWIHAAPAQWTRGRIKNLIASATNGTWGNDPKEDGDDVHCIRAADFDRTKRRVRISQAPLRSVDVSTLRHHQLEPGDLVLEKSGGGEKQPVGMAVLFEESDKAVCSNFCARISPERNVDARFLTYVFAAAYGQGLTQSAIKQTTGIQNLDASAFFSAAWAYPELDEQRRIADFLDTETAHIERLSALRVRSLGLLSERSASQMDLTIRGLPTRQTKQAEYIPLGEIPANWQEARLRSIDCKVQTGPFGSQLHAEDYVEDAYPVVNPANITPVGLVADRTVTVSAEVREHLARHVLRKGDVIFGRRGELGRASVVQEEQDGWVCGTGSLRVRFQSDAFHSGYLRRYLAIPAVRHYFQLHAIGSTMPNLNSEILLNMPLLLPDRGEQATLSQRCDEIETWSSTATQYVKQQVQLLAERRQALITAAVTGQFDVSTASGRNFTDGVSA